MQTGCTEVESYARAIKILRKKKNDESVLVQSDTEDFDSIVQCQSKICSRYFKITIIQLIFRCERKLQMIIVINKNIYKLPNQTFLYLTLNRQRSPRNFRKIVK